MILVEIEIMIQSDCRQVTEILVISTLKDLHCGVSGILVTRTVQ